MHSRYVQCKGCRSKYSWSTMHEMRINKNETKSLLINNKPLILLQHVIFVRTLS